MYLKYEWGLKVIRDSYIYCYKKMGTLGTVS